MARVGVLVATLGSLATIAAFVWTVASAPTPASVPEPEPVGTAARLEAVLVSAHRFDSADRCRDDGTLEADADRGATAEDLAAPAQLAGTRKAPVWYTAEGTVIVPVTGHGVLRLCGVLLDPPSIAAACVAPWGMGGSEAVRWVNRPEGAGATSAVTDLDWKGVAGATQAAVGGLDGSLLVAALQPGETSSGCLAHEPQPLLEAGAPADFVGSAVFVEWLPARYGSVCAKSSVGGC